MRLHHPGMLMIGNGRERLPAPLFRLVGVRAPSRIAPRNFGRRQETGRSTCLRGDPVRGFHRNVRARRRSDTKPLGSSQDRLNDLSLDSRVWPRDPLRPAGHGRFCYFKLIGEVALVGTENLGRSGNNLCKCVRIWILGAPDNTPLGEFIWRHGYTFGLDYVHRNFRVQDASKSFL